MDLEGKTAIVTGGAVRVGRAIVMALAGAGCRVLIHYGRSEDEARQTLEAVETLGVEAAIWSADLSDAAAVPGVVDEAVRRFGSAEILINSAALFLEGDLAATTTEQWKRQFDVNLRAPMLLCQAFAAALSGSARGAIVNIVDARIFRPAGDHFAYRLTKVGLHAMTEMLAHELAPRITVNAVALGAILPPPGEDESYLRRLAEQHVPLRAHGNAEMVGDNVLHLLRCDFITGATVRLDGAQFL